MTAPQIEAGTPWEQDGAAARRAVAQFKSKQPIDAACPSCGQVIGVNYVEAPSDSFVTQCGCKRSNRTLSPDASDGVMADAILRSRGLHHGTNAYVGAAFFRYPGAQMTYEEAVEKLKRDNPGLCQDAYDIVIHDNIRGMR